MQLSFCFVVWMAFSSIATAVASAPLSYPEFLQATAPPTNDNTNLSTSTEFEMKPLILGGTEVPIGQKTYVATLRNLPSVSGFCGGSLITPKYVLTAAHCMAGGINYVAVGSHFRMGTNDDAEYVKVVKLTRHPEYRQQTNSYDFVLLELERAVTKFAPVALAKADDSEYVAGTTATTMGWGATVEGGKPSNVLLRVDVNLLDNATCQQKLKVDDTMLCAGGEKNKDACQGDSGGPLVIEKANQDVLVGVVSWGQGCGRLGFPGVYARISSVRDWLDSVAKGVKWL